MTRSPTSPAQSAFAKLQLDCEAQSAEIGQLRAALADRDSLIATLKQNQECFPSSCLSTEISIFAEFAESTAQRLVDAQVLTQHERQNLAASADRFAAIVSLEHPKLKVTQFFDEAHRFCHLLADKAIRSATIAQPEIPSANVLLHESEIQKVRIQHQLYRLQRQFDEARSDNHVLSEQIKAEHNLITQLTEKLFPDAPIYEDDQFVRKEVRRMETHFQQQGRTIADLRERAAQAQSLVAQFAGDNELPFSGELLTDLKTAINYAESQPSALKRISDATRSSSSTVDSIVGEIQRLQEAESQLAEAQSMLAVVHEDNAQLQSKLESLEIVSADNNSLTELVRRQRHQLSDSQSEISRLAESVAALSAQDKIHISEKSAMARELSEIKTKSRITAKRYSKVSDTLAKAQSDITELTEIHSSAMAKRDVLSRELVVTQSELRKKTCAIETLSIQLQSANERITELVAKVNSGEAEIERLRVSEVQLKNVTRENANHLSEIQKQSARIAALSPLRGEVERLSAEVEERGTTLADLRIAYDANCERLAELKLKAVEGQIQKKRIADFEETIESLTSELSAVRAMATMRESTIAELNSALDSFRSQIRDLQQSVADMSARSAQLQNSLTEANDRVEKLSTENRLLHATSDDYEAFRASANSTERKLCEDVNAAREETVSLANEVQQLTSRIAILEREIGNYDDSNRRLSNDIEEQAAQASAHYEQLQSKIRRLASKLSVAKARLLEASKHIDILTQRGDEAEVVIAQLKSDIEAKEIALPNLESQPLSESEGVSRLEADAARAGPTNEGLQKGLDDSRDKSAPFESKTVIIDELNTQLHCPESGNESPTTQLSKDQECEHEPREERELATNTPSESAHPASLLDENTESAMTISELEGEQKENQGIIQQLKVAAKENRRLNRTVRSLNEEIDRLSAELGELRKEPDASQDLANLAVQKDELIAELKIMADSQEEVVRQLRQENERLQQTYRCDSIIEKIERTLGEFEVESLEGTGTETISARLHAIHALIERIREVFEEQRGSVERMSRLTTSQHTVIMKLSRETLERGSAD
jgi:chromosome segregation ATPase